MNDIDDIKSRISMTYDIILGLERSIEIMEAEIRVLKRKDRSKSI